MNKERFHDSLQYSKTLILWTNFFMIHIYQNIPAAIVGIFFKAAISHLRGYKPPLTPPPLLQKVGHQKEFLAEKWNFLFNARIQGRARNVQAGCMYSTYLLLFFFWSRTADMERLSVWLVNKKKRNIYTGFQCIESHNV